MSAQILGVGIVGAGPVTQSIHLPTLARMTDQFRVVNVMDVSPDIATSVASRVGARASTNLDELLADEAVEVVAVCSPPQFHAQQVIAAMEAGKKAILCEKPFATTPEEAEAIADASRRLGVPVIVGAMHTFDPGWQQAKEVWDEILGQAHTVRSRIVLAPNERYEDWATEVLSRPAFNMGAGGADPVEQVRGMINGLILGLAVHDLPLVRSFLSDGDALHVDTAQVLPPAGYLIAGRVGDCAVQLIGAVNGHWESFWELEAIADTTMLSIRFTPSFVNAGSAVASLRSSDGSTRVFGPYPYNGYESEWRSLYRLAQGDSDAAPPLSTLLDDLSFLLSVSEQSTAAAVKELQS